MGRVPTYLRCAKLALNLQELSVRSWNVTRFMSGLVALWVWPRPTHTEVLYIQGCPSERVCCSILTKPSVHKKETGLLRANIWAWRGDFVTCEALRGERSRDYGICKPRISNPRRIKQKDLTAMSSSMSTCVRQTAPPSCFSDGNLNLASPQLYRPYTNDPYPAPEPFFFSPPTIFLEHWPP